MTKKTKEFGTAEKAIALLSIGLLLGSLLLGYREYGLGIALAAPVAWYFYRWQMMAVVNAEGLSPRKATIRLVARSGIRLFVFIGMIGLSSLGGETFFFGVLTGLLLQIVSFIGQAFYVRGKGGMV